MNIHLGNVFPPLTIKPFIAQSHHSSEHQTPDKKNSQKRAQKLKKQKSFTFPKFSSLLLDGNEENKNNNKKVKKKQQ